MGFKCADLINSRVIGTIGSEKLTTKGRMLLKLPIFSDLRELQAPYLSLEEAKKLLKGHKSKKDKNTNKYHHKPSNNVISMKETENNIFEVLDE